MKPALDPEADECRTVTDTSTLHDVNDGLKVSQAITRTVSELNKH